jgi:secreted trypsin-like serine protease
MVGAMRRRLAHPCAALLACQALSVAAAGVSAAPSAHKSIVGGTPADPSQFPFITTVETQHSLCTGSVISPTRVLTAAHCIESDAPGLTVRTGSATAFSGGEVHPVSSIAINPGWTHSLQSDLAVLTLSQPTSVTPIPLATEDQDALLTRPGASLTAAGYGRRSPWARGKPKVGLLASTQVVAFGFCPLPHGLMCDAGGRTGLVAKARIKGRLRKRPVMKSVCSGDSGGPLIASTSTGPVQVGVAEAALAAPRRSPWGKVYCGLKGAFSLHTRVAEYQDFLGANLGP